MNIKPFKKCSVCGVEGYASKMVVNLQGPQVICSGCDTKSKDIGPKPIPSRDICPVCGRSVLGILDDFEVARVRFRHTKDYCQMPAEDYRLHVAKQREEKCR